MKAQDLLVAMWLAGGQEPPAYAALGAAVGISASEAHAAIKRLRASGLVDHERRVNRGALRAFLLHGARTSFPASLGGPTMGVPTGAAAPGVSDVPAPEFGPWVWPSPEGTIRGLALRPLYSSVPEAVAAHPDLHTRLALLDLIRAGSAREVRHAQHELLRWLDGPRARAYAAPIDVASVDALLGIFASHRVRRAIAKRLNAHRFFRPGMHPLEPCILAEYGEDLAELLAAVVPSGAWAPGPAYRIRTSKVGGLRDLMFPSITDGVVARRVVDELEPHVRRDDEERVFLNRSHASSRLPPGEYDAWHAEFMSFLAQTDRAASDAQLAVAVKTDIREFYPSVDRQLALQALAAEGNVHGSILRLYDACLEAWLPRFDYRRGTGIPIEPNDFSGLVAHALLRSVDAQFEDGYDLRYRRYVDDTFLFVEDRAAGERLLMRHRRALEAIGLRPNPSKERILPIEAFRAERHAAEFATIEAVEEADDLRELARFTARWLEAHDSEAPGHLRVMRRLYTAHGRTGSSALKGRALEDASIVSLRGSAHRYLRSLVFDPGEIDHLFAVYDSANDPMGRVEASVTLAAASVGSEPLPADVVRGAVDRFLDEEAGPGHGYARAMLMLFIFKHEPLEHLDTITDRLTPGRASDPHVQMMLEYVLAAARTRADVPAPPSWIGASGGSDFLLQRKLLQAAETGGIRNMAACLRPCRRLVRGRWVLRAQALPLLWLLARGAKSQPSGTSLEAWLLDAVDGARRTDDPAVLAHLRALLLALHE